MPDVQTPGSADPNTAVPGAPDPLAHLYHMSTTAGVGTQDYAAINPTAIAALLLGLASAMVVLGDILLILPAVGLICAVVALVQISHSNQTQTGKGLALLALLLCFAFGGGRLGYDAYTHSRAAADERQITDLMHQLGDDLKNARYEQAYGLFDDRFRARVSLETFKTTWQGLENNSLIGRVVSVDWNHQAMEFERSPDGTTAAAAAMSLFRFGQPNSPPSRLIMQFEKSEGGWKISNVPNFFSTKKPK